MAKSNTQALLIADDGPFPNNGTLPLVLMQQVFDPKTRDLAGTIEKTFHENAWGGSWRNGIYGFHHYHSTAHEVLGIYAGWVKVQFGGPNGTVVSAGIGDAIILPAGVSHRNLDQSPDFRCVGAYPAGQSPDMQYGKSGERPRVEEIIRAVPLPDLDPVFGQNGPLLEIWEDPMHMSLVGPNHTTGF